jgi:hypothetical protein
LHETVHAPALTISHRCEKITAAAPLMHGHALKGLCFFRFRTDHLALCVRFHVIVGLSTAASGVEGVAWGRAAAVWLAIIAAESVHGAARALWLVPLVGDLRSRQIGVVTGSMLILAITAASLDWLRAESRRALAVVGLLWAVLTMLFEFVFGRYVLGVAWGRLLADYDLAQGGLMGFGLMLMACAPLIAQAALRRWTFAA